MIEYLLDEVAKYEKKYMEYLEVGDSTKANRYKEKEDFFYNMYCMVVDGYKWRDLQDMIKAHQCEIVYKR